MCMMCEDEKSYATYLAYLDAIQKGGKDASPDAAKEEVMNEVMKAMEQAARERWNRDPWSDDAANDQTLSIRTPFVCTPVEK